MEEEKKLNKIIDLLLEIDVNGEQMEWILNKTNMRNQMFNQLCRGFGMVEMLNVDFEGDSLGAKLEKISSEIKSISVEIKKKV